MTTSRSDEVLTGNAHSAMVVRPYEQESERNEGYYDRELEC